jgi:hypothetical protein
MWYEVNICSITGWQTLKKFWLYKNIIKYKLYEMTYDIMQDYAKKIILR